MRRIETPISASHLTRLTYFDRKIEDTPHLSLDLVPCSSKITTPLSPFSRPQNPLRRSKTCLVEKLDMAEEPVDPNGLRRQCKNRNGSMGLLGYASPRNGRRSRRWLELEIREERDLGMVEKMDEVEVEEDKRETGDGGGVDVNDRDDNDKEDEDVQKGQMSRRKMGLLLKILMKKNWMKKNQRGQTVNGSGANRVMEHRVLRSRYHCEDSNQRRIGSDEIGPSINIEVVLEGAQLRGAQSGPAASNNSRGFDRVQSVEAQPKLNQIRVLGGPSNEDVQLTVNKPESVVRNGSIRRRMGRAGGTRGRGKRKAQSTQTSFVSGFNRGAVLRAAAAALSQSLSKESQERRRRKKRVEEASETLQLGNRLGMNCEGKEAEVLQRI
ncbi:unnamed protein product [Camellia sinensis]